MLPFFHAFFDQRSRPSRHAGPRPGPRPPRPVGPVGPVAGAAFRLPGSDAGHRIAASAAVFAQPTVGAGPDADEDPAGRTVMPSRSPSPLALSVSLPPSPWSWAPDWADVDVEVDMDVDEEAEDEAEARAWADVQVGMEVEIESEPGPEPGPGPGARSPGRVPAPVGAAGPAGVAARTFEPLQTPPPELPVGARVAGVLHRAPLLQRLNLGRDLVEDHPEWEVTTPMLEIGRRLARSRHDVCALTVLTHLAYRPDLQTGGRTALDSQAGWLADAMRALRTAIVASHRAGAAPGQLPDRRWLPRLSREQALRVEALLRFVYPLEGDWTTRSRLLELWLGAD